VEGLQYVERPLDSGRHPFEVFVLVLGLVVGSPLLWGAPTPGTTTELLGPFWSRVWGYILVIGCLVALTGVWWTWWRWLTRWRSRWRWAGRWLPAVHPRFDTGLLIEQVGLVAVAVGTVIYAIGVIAAEEQNNGRYVPAALIGGFGLAALWRAGQIQRWVLATIQRQAQR